VQDKIENIEQRVSELERWRHEKDVKDAVESERIIHIEKTVVSLDKKVTEGFKRLDGYISRIVWIIVGTGIVALVTFALQGGLSNAVGG